MMFERLMQVGGPMMWPLALLGCAGLPVTFGCMLAALLMRQRRRAALALSLVLIGAAALILGLGAGGYFRGMHLTHEALRNVAPEDRETILASGGSEARAPLVVAFSGAIAPMAGGLSLLGLGLLRFRVKESPQKEI